MSWQRLAAGFPARTNNQCAVLRRQFDNHKAASKVAGCPIKPRPRDLYRSQGVSRQIAFHAPQERLEGLQGNELRRAHIYAPFHA